MDGQTQSAAREPGRGALDAKLAWGLLSALAIAIGSIGTWVTVGPISLGGTGDGRDGTITLVLALVALVPLALRRLRPLVGVLAAVCLLIGIIDTVDVSSNDVAIFEASVGWGLWLVDAAAVSLLLWTFLGRSRRPAEAEAEAEPAPAGS